MRLMITLKKKVVALCMVTKKGKLWPGAGYQPQMANCGLAHGNQKGQIVALCRVQANLKCRNPANLFTIARFHYRKGSYESRKAGKRKNYCMWHSVRTFPTLTVAISSTYLSACCLSILGRSLCLHNADLDVLY